jgi:signal transduction histidine kinase
MVLDILYYAKDREPNWEELSGAPVLEEVCGVIDPKATDLGVTIEKVIDPKAGTFEADAKAIRTLLVNLTENSLDACRLDQKKAEHRVKLSLMGDIDHIRFEIEDNGIGMDQETREKAFSLFFSSKGTEGTGLGLFISNKIAQAHGGSITLESRENEGTRFIVSLPRNRPIDHANGALSKPEAPDINSS